MVQREELLEKINGKLREAVGWGVLGRKVLALLHLESGANPGDSPSRFLPLEAPATPEEWMTDLLRPDGPPLTAPGRKPPRRECRECFAGEAGLTAALSEVGLLVGSPLEAFPIRDGRRSYDCGQDLCEPPVYEGLIADARSGRSAYLHFGFPRRTWDPAGLRAGEV